MGRQIGFFMTQADEDMFIQYIEQRGDTTILCNENSPSNELAYFDKEKFHDPERQIRYYFWNKDISPTPPMKLIVTYDGDRYWSLDTLSVDSEIIEFWRNFPLDKTDFSKRWSSWSRGIAGRLYIDAFALSDDMWQKKGERFIKLYESFVRWIKKNAQGRTMDYGYNIYLMPGACKFLTSMGKTVLPMR